MLKTKRKRAVVLALLAFFCCGAMVGVDWKRLGGGLLAFFKGKHDPVVVVGGHEQSGVTGALVTAAVPAPAPPGPHLAAATVRRGRHLPHDGRGAGAGGQADDDDLFKYGLPAAGGIPPGSFVVAQNDMPVGSGADSPVLVGPGAAAPSGGVTSPAPGPLTGPTDAGLPASGRTAPSPAPAPAPTPASPSPAPTPAGPAPAPAPGSDPSQSGVSDQDPGGLGSTPAPAPASPVAEASPLTMMALGALFVAVAAARRRRGA
jgi:hypothetical protein